MRRARYYVFEQFYGENGLTEHQPVDENFSTLERAVKYLRDNLNTLRCPYIKYRGKRVDFSGIGITDLLRRPQK